MTLFLVEPIASLIDRCPIAIRAFCTVGRSCEPPDVLFENRIPGPIRTRMRATAMPGEDPMTLDVPENVAEKILDLCLPRYTETGTLYNYRVKNFLS